MSAGVGEVSDFRAEQVGSLLRPPELQQAWGQFFAGELDRSALVEIEDRAIMTALEGQRAAGIDVYTDGEFRRVVYMGGLMDAVEGFMFGQGEKLNWKTDPGREVPTEMAEFALPAVAERLRPKGRIAAHEAAFMRQYSPGPFKVTLPSAAHFAEGSYRPELSARAYPSRSDLVHHLAEILSKEAADLVREGTTYIQVDSPTYSTWMDPAWLAEYEDRGVDMEDLLEATIAADNAILDAARSGGALTAVHVCRGNGMGAWLASGGYERIAERVFGELRCDRFLLEYDTERAGTFEALRLIPALKMVVLGVISTKYGALEPRDEILRRIEEAGRFVPVERLALSTQCGFASDFRGNPLTPDEQWRKLELVVSVAREVWG